MDITYLGAGSVKLSGRQLNLVIDPYTEANGLGKFQTKADVAIFTTLPGDTSPQFPMTIDGPGEYEVKGSSVRGVSAQLHIDESGRRGTVYAVQVDGVNVVVLGNVAGKLHNDDVETLGSVDVLVVPVGGHGLTLDAEGAAALVAQLEPGYVVPVHYADPKTTYDMPQDEVGVFLREMGSTPEPQPRLRVNAKEIPAETELVVLTRVGS